MTWAADWIPDDKQALLDMLKAKDAQFDNLSIEFERHEALTTNPLAEWINESIVAEKAGRKVPSLPDSSGDPSASETLQLERLTVRGGETTYEVEPIEVNASAVGAGEVAVRTKTNNVTGVQQNLTFAGDVVVFHDDTRPAEKHGLLAEKRMLIEFTLGVGYGSRIVAISSVEEQGENAVVEATMRLWSEDVTKATLTIDDNLVVRNASLLADSRGNITRFEISTFGLTESPDGSEIAQSGRLVRTALTANVAGKSLGLDDRIDDSYSLITKSIRHKLSDDEYLSLVKIDRSLATHVVDMMPKPKSAKSDQPGHTPWMLIINALVVLSLGLYLVYRRVVSSNSSGNS